MGRVGGEAGNIPTTEGSIPREVGTDESRASASKRYGFAPPGFSTLGLAGGVGMREQHVSQEQNAQNLCFQGRSHGVGEDHTAGGCWGLSTGKITGIPIAQSKQTNRLCLGFPTGPGADPSGHGQMTKGLCREALKRCKVPISSCHHPFGTHGIRALLACQGCPESKHRAGGRSLSYPLLLFPVSSLSREWGQPLTSRVSAEPRSLEHSF